MALRKRGLPAFGGQFIQEHRTVQLGVDFQLVLRNFLDGLANRLKQPGVANGESHRERGQKLNPLHAEQPDNRHEHRVVCGLVVGQLANGVFV